MAYTPLIAALVEALRGLPGVGPKSAQRMAYHMLERDRHGAQALAGALQAAIDGVGRCRLCRDFSEGETCPLCADTRRDTTQLCVVESPSDVQALEQATGYRGLYFVLMGHLSPIDGIGPSDIGLDHLGERLAQGEVQELILATNPTIEGEATAHYIADMARDLPIQLSRLAHGVPVGGELEYVDGGTLAHAFNGRRKV